MKRMRGDIIFFILINIIVFCYILKLENILKLEKYLLFIDLLIAEFILKNMLVIDRTHHCKFLKILKRTFIEKIIYLIWIITFLIRLEVILVDSIKLKIFLAYINEYCFGIIFLRIFFEIVKTQRKISFINHQESKEWK